MLNNSDKESQAMQHCSLFIQIIMEQGTWVPSVKSPM